MRAASPEPKPEPEEEQGAKATALYDYEAAEEGELSESEPGGVGRRCLLTVSRSSSLQLSSRAMSSPTYRLRARIGGRAGLAISKVASRPTMYSYMTRSFNPFEINLGSPLACSPVAEPRLLHSKARRVSP